MVLNFNERLNFGETFSLDKNPCSIPSRLVSSWLKISLVGLVSTLYYEESTGLKSFTDADIPVGRGSPLGIINGLNKRLLGELAAVFFGVFECFI